MIPLLLSLVFLSPPRAIAADPIRAVTVAGECLRPVTPDRAAYSVAIEIRDSSIRKASAKASETYDQLKNSLQKLRLKDVEFETTEYTLGEHREWENNKSVLKGYRARTGLRVETSEIPRIGEVIDQTAKQNVEGGSLSVFVSRERWKSEYQECLSTAIADARGKAERMAKAADSSLGRAISIEEEGTHPVPMPAPMSDRAMIKSAGESIPTIDTTAAKMTVRVQVSYELK